MSILDVYGFVQIYRNESPASFTAETPDGSHPAWFFTVDATGAVHGPYMSRQDAETAAHTLLGRLCTWCQEPETDEAPLLLFLVPSKTPTRGFFHRLGHDGCQPDGARVIMVSEAK